MGNMLNQNCANSVTNFKQIVVTYDLAGISYLLLCRSLVLVFYLKIKEK